MLVCFANLELLIHDRVSPIDHLLVPHYKIAALCLDRSSIDLVRFFRDLRIDDLRVQHLLNLCQLLPA